MTTNHDRALLALTLDMIKERVMTGVAEAKANLAANMVVTGREPVEADGVLVGYATYARGAEAKVVARVTDMDALTEFAWGGPVAVGEIVTSASPGPGDNPTAVRVKATLTDWYVTEVLKRAEQGEVMPGVEADWTEPGEPVIRVVRTKTPEASAALISAVQARGLSILALDPGREATTSSETPPFEGPPTPPFEEPPTSGLFT